MKKGHSPGACNVTPLSTWFPQFVVRAHAATYHKLKGELASGDW